MKRIVCFHLFNDYSGSPKVLKTVIEGMLAKGDHIDLMTSRGGVLDEIPEHPNLRRRQYNYRFARNKFLRLLRYSRVQLKTFFIALGAALGGRIAGKRVVYHYHENAKAKSLAYRILAKLMQFIASDIICVSHYQRAFVKRKKRVYVIPNALQERFAQEVTPDSENAFKQQRVLMLGSLKEYKGTREFIELASELSDFNFELVINDSQDNIDSYLKSKEITPPGNITIHPRQKSVAPFYNRASILLNLSKKSLFIETFGLTALEAMTAGIPVIVPTVGGIAEMVTDGVNGYKIDVQEMQRIKETIKYILTNKEIFLSLAGNSSECSKKYGVDHLIGNIRQIITAGCSR